jgi:hypothetical protein
MPRPRPSPEFEAQVIALTAEGWTKRRIAHHLGTRIDVVGHTLRRAGIRKREAERKTRVRSWHRPEPACSKAPPPPPGFRESDLYTGRPYA